MATLTAILSIRKPDGTDFVSRVNDLNNNWDLIDALFNSTTGHKHAGSGTSGAVVTINESQVIYDAVEAATLDALAGGSMLINNMNRVRYWLTQISGQGLGTVGTSLNAHVTGTGTVHTGASFGFANGTVAAPSAFFSSETGSGLYRIGASDIALAISGVKAVEWTATSTTIVQPLTTGSTLTVTGAAVVSGASLSIGTTPATSGVIRMPNNSALTSRNAANSADVSLIGIDGSNLLSIDNGLIVSDAGGNIGIPNALKLGTTPSTVGAVRLPNNNLIAWRNNANTANIGITLDTTDVLTMAGVGGLAVGSTPATAGVIRLPNNSVVMARNAANNGDVGLIYLDNSNNVLIGAGGNAPNSVNTSVALVVSGAYMQIGTNPSTFGLIRIPNNTYMYARNAANSSDRGVIGLDSGNNVNIGDANVVSIGMYAPTNHLKQYYAASNNLSGITGATTVDWNNSNVQLGTMNGNVTFTFNNPVSGARYILVLLQDATGGRTVTWPAAVKWSGGTAPTLSGANKYDVIGFVYAFGNYYGSASLNY